MGSPNAIPPPVSLRTEGDRSPSAIGDRTNDGCGPSLPHQSSIDPVESDSLGRVDDITQLARLLADALKGGVAELRKDDEARMSQFTTTFQKELSEFRRDEEDRLARLEKTITSWKPEKLKTDPNTNFWTVYKKVADEHDNDLVSKYVGDLDTSLLFAGLFSAITSSFIIQIIPSLQPNPSDLTNSLLLRILQQNTSFDGADPLAPVTTIPTSAIRAQSILLASFTVTLFVAFIAVLGKQWILYYTRVTTWGNIADRGKERQVKLVGLQKWGLHLIMESLPVMLQFALLLFGVALTVYLWELEVSAAEVVLIVTCIGFIFYSFIAATATIWPNCPFQTPLSILLPQVFPWTKEFTANSRIWLRRRAAALLPRVQRVKGYGWLTKPLERVLVGVATTPNQAVGDPANNDPQMALSNPELWRHEPLFVPPVPKDIAASAGFWMLENSTDFSASTAVAAIFSEFQWPSHQRSNTALIRFRDVYVECFRAPEFNKATRLKALQTAAAYYVFYHTQLIWSASKSFQVEVGRIPSDLPPDLFLHKETGHWGGDDLFEYLLHIKERSEPVTSARFLSYIAPYWFCGDSDSAIRFRTSRLQIVNELIQVLEDSQAFTAVTLTNCMLCVGATMDFPLHPEDLIRVDKSNYFQRTFKMVVEHVHRIAVEGGRRRRYVRAALEIILTLVKKTTLPLVDAAWINELLGSAAVGRVDDEIFVLFLKLRASTKEEEPPFGQDYVPVTNREADPGHLGVTVASEDPTPEYTLFSKISKNVQTCSEREGGWQDEAVYGGLIAIRDIHRLGTCLPKVTFLKTLSYAMEKSDATEGFDAAEKNKPKFRVRKAAYNVIRAAQDGWLRSPALRHTLKEYDFPRKLYSVLIETGRADHQRSFLIMMETLSEDRQWHSYLRGAMDIWLPFRHEGPDQVIRILTSVGEIPFPESDGPYPTLDTFLVKIVEEEWARVPGRPAMNLSPDLLGPLAEVTTQLKELLFTDSDRREVLAAVARVIPSLERRRDDDYGGPGEDIRGIIEGLLDVLRMSQSASRRSTYW